MAKNKEVLWLECNKGYGSGRETSDSPTHFRTGDPAKDVWYRAIVKRMGVFYELAPGEGDLPAHAQHPWVWKKPRLVRVGFPTEDMTQGWAALEEWNAGQKHDAPAELPITDEMRQEVSQGPKEDADA